MEETIGIDFEFYNSNEKEMKVIACVLSSREYGDLKYDCTQLDQVQNLKEQLQLLKEDNVILLAYAAIAEARALLSIGIDPIQFKWIDLYVEFRMLCNSNNEYNYGNYIPKTGGIGYSTPSDPTLSEEERENEYGDHTEMPKNLINAVFQLLHIRFDGHHKDIMRDLILSKDSVKIHAHMDEILRAYRHSY